MRHDKGVTLVEACIVVAVCAVVALSAVPGMQQLLERQALRAAAEALRTDLHYLRSASVQRGRTLWMGLHRHRDSSCYVLYSGARDGCRCGPEGSAACAEGSQALKAVALDAQRGLQLQASATTLAFEPLRGTVTPTTTFTLAARSGATVREVLNLLGRVRLCSPDAMVPGYARC